MIEEKDTVTPTISQDIKRQISELEIQILRLKKWQKKERRAEEFTDWATKRGMDTTRYVGYGDRVFRYDHIDSMFLGWCSALDHAGVEPS